MFHVPSPLHYHPILRLLLNLTTPQALRTHTKEKLYESYRTERLLAQKERAQKGPFSLFPHIRGA